MVQAVIFDMDGTLVDSERLGFKGWEMASQELGIPVSPELAQSFVGRNHRAVMELLTDAVGDAQAADRVYRRHWEIRRALAARELEPKPGALDAVAQLIEQGRRLAIASSSAYDAIEANLTAVRLLDAFDVIVCGSDVEQGKPAPDIFLLAAERLGVAPEACAVVEDSPNGVKAGHAAGMPVFLVPDVVPPTPAIEALCAARLETLAELPAALDACTGASEMGARA